MYVHFIADRKKKYIFGIEKSSKRHWNFGEVRQEFFWIVENFFFVNFSVKKNSTIFVVKIFKIAGGFKSLDFLTVSIYRLADYTMYLPHVTVDYLM